MRLEEDFRCQVRTEPHLEFSLVMPFTEASLLTHRVYGLCILLAHQIMCSTEREGKCISEVRILWKTNVQN